MWFILKSAVFLMLFCSVFGALCPESENATKKFVIVEQKVNWFGALLACNSQGMTLATIESKQEQDQLVDLIKESYDTLPHDTNSPDNRWWLGAASLHEDRQFVWFSTGKAMNYENFKPGNPSHNYLGVKEQCVELRDHQGWAHRWNDVDCSTKLPFVCEYFE